jgi:hypothetical protein
MIQAAKTTAPILPSAESTLNVTYMEPGSRLATNGHIQVEDGSGGQQSQQHKQAANKPRHDNHYQPPCFDAFP